ncbi:ATP-dependent RNA helicase [Devriesea agamarum]|uniref:ATP-dependent RNA helicase n=1 Tax=Devriesea agamarum TaxID=472569 RepID=UPI00071C322E|nr:ATP-dependent helicase C-terminal domain-containing protein [Devriesea agamarum]
MPRPSHPHAAPSSTRPFNLERIGRGLAAVDLLAALPSTLAHGNGVAVIQAPPGSGKTTLIPPAIANLTSAQRVIVTQPRRIAARAAARRLAQLTSTSVGDIVGFSVRGEHRIGPETVIEFCTPGVLLRRVLTDPELAEIGAVVLDEVHERALDTDLLIGMLRDLRELRDDLSLVAMSATVDADRFAQVLGTDTSPAPILSCPATQHPLSVRWAPPSGTRLGPRGVERDFLDHVARVAVTSLREALSDEPLSNALVFAPGVREVEHIVQRARCLANDDMDVLSLHGGLTARDQDRVIAGRSASDRARLIVSTAVAESSLTVPGVRLVIDTGLAREPRRDSVRGMHGLVTVSAASASCAQRAGRAARLGPGTVVRCYSEYDAARAPAFPTPEVRTADLVDAVLTLACWGTPRGRGLRLPEPLPDKAADDAEQTLKNLGAVHPDGSASAYGKRLARIPADPRHAHALIRGAAVLDADGRSSRPGARRAAEVIALLTSDVRYPDADVTAVLGRLRRGDDSALAASWRHERDRLLRLLGTPEASSAGLPVANRLPGADRQSEPGPPGVTQPDATHPAVAQTDITRPDIADNVRRDGIPNQLADGLILALAAPERIARRVSPRVTSSDRTQYLLASGTRATVPHGSALAHHEFLAVADVTRTPGAKAHEAGAVIRAAAPINLDVALLAAPGSHRHTVLTDITRDGAISARRVARLGAIELSSTPMSPPAEQAIHAVAEHLIREGIGRLRNCPKADDLRRRLMFVHAHVGAPWPDVSDAGLVTVLTQHEDVLATVMSSSSSPTRVPSLLEVLRTLLPWPEASQLDELAPTHLNVPSGSRVRLTYPAPEDYPRPTSEPVSDSSKSSNVLPTPAPGGDASASTLPRPVVAVKLQECFGLERTPSLLHGRVRLLFNLLSPARRPVAVTDDLASFWSGPYQEVRKEMRGRYPKHPWPEDPWTHEATALTTRRLRDA